MSTIESTLLNRHAQGSLCTCNLLRNWLEVETLNKDKHFVARLGDTSLGKAIGVDKFSADTAPRPTMSMAIRKFANAVKKLGKKFDTNLNTIAAVQEIKGKFHEFKGDIFRIDQHMGDIARLKRLAVITPCDKRKEDEIVACPCLYQRLLLQVGFFSQNPELKVPLGLRERFIQFKERMRYSGAMRRSERSHHFGVLTLWFKNSGFRQGTSF